MPDYAIIIVAILLGGFVGYKIGVKKEKKRQDERVAFAVGKYKRLQAQIQEYMINSSPDYKERF